MRSIHGSARDVAREIRSTVQYQRSRHQRKKVEMLFAHLKRILKLDRLRLRGLSGACDEFTLAAAVQNLRRLAKLIPQGHEARIDVSITDEYPLAQAFVVISAVPLGT